MYDAHPDWHWHIEASAAGETLVLAWRGLHAANNVELLLDGQDTREHPLTHGTAAPPSVMATGAELRFPYALPRRPGPFRTLRIRWCDELGARLEVEHDLTPSRA